MAFEPNFSVVQNDESTITLVDESTGSDATITERRISLVTYDTTTLVPTGTSTTYILWPIVSGIGDTITITDIFPKDYALDISVLWYTPTPDPDTTYIDSELFISGWYNMIELGGLITEKMARDPNIIRDTNFINYFFAFYAEIIAARISVGLLNDIFKSQFCLEIATNMRSKETLYF